MLRTRLAGSALLLVLSGLALRAADPHKSAGVNVAAVGVLAPSGKVLFLPGDSHVEAVAVFNGKPLWTSEDATRPLLATADHVFAQARVKGKRNQVKVVILDATTGERVRESETITFPDWVSVQPDYGLRFRSAARLDKDGFLFIWEARTFRDGGPPPPEFGPDGKPYVDPNAKQAGGAVRVDAATGRVSTVKDYKPKDTDFPSELGTKTTANGWVFRVEQVPTDTGKPYALLPRRLVAEREDGKGSWKRPIDSEVNLPPRP